MNTSKTQNDEYIDTLTQDFKSSVIIVSLTANLAVFVAWLAIAV